MNAYRIVFSTVVGSHMWGMNHEGSDRDIMTAVAFPTEDILSGRSEPKNFAQKHLPEKGLDIQTGEIGKWIDQLILGNTNYLWGVLSPVVEVGSPDLIRLREIVLATRSKATLASVRGLAASAFAQSGKRDKGIKQYGIAMRTLGFGIRWVAPDNSCLLFETFGSDPTFATGFSMEQMYAARLADLLDAENRSALPSRPDPEPLREFLLDLRLRHLDPKLLKLSNST